MITYHNNTDVADQQEFENVKEFGKFYITLITSNYETPGNAYYESIDGFEFKTFDECQEYHAQTIADQLSNYDIEYSDYNLTREDGIFNLDICDDNDDLIEPEIAEKISDLLNSKGYNQEIFAWGIGYDLEDLI